MDTRSAGLTRLGAGAARSVSGFATNTAEAALKDAASSEKSDENDARDAAAAGYAGRRWRSR